MLRSLIPTDDPNALVDAQTRDDAAVYRIDDARALVVTLDFFTPIVDDPADFGRIAAANALSDVYAMGAKPLFALNLLSFPRDLLDREIVEHIVRGGAEKALEAGIPILGGHSIDDPEPKYGMVVVGEVDPAHMMTNDQAKAGDQLVLTKPLGTGVVATAIKAGACPGSLVEEATRVMSQLNREAAAAAVEAGAHSATDVTGYGLVGHLGNMLRASGVAARLDVGRVPVLDGVRELVEAGYVPGGTKRNMVDGADAVTYEPGVGQTDRILLSDAQTSGGLLISISPDRMSDLLSALEAEGIPSACIGEVTEGTAGTITVTA